MNIFICNLPDRLYTVPFLEIFSERAQMFFRDSFDMRNADGIRMETQVKLEPTDTSPIVCTQARGVFKGKEGTISNELARILEELCVEEGIWPADFRPVQQIH